MKHFLLLAVLGAVTTARAELCPKCADRMYTMDTKQCPLCQQGWTGSGAFAMCKTCSAKLGQCEHCRAALAKAPAPAAAEAKLAAAWVTHLLAGKVEEIMALSAVPFSWDRKEVVKTADELRALFQQVAAKKGARDWTPDGAEALTGDPAADALKKHSLLEDATIVPVKITVKGEAIVVLVKPGAEPRVIGFSD
jgi:hypothetical protein